MKTTVYDLLVNTKDKEIQIPTTVVKRGNITALEHWLDLEYPDWTSYVLTGVRQLDLTIKED